MWIKLKNGYLNVSLVRTITFTDQQDSGEERTRPVGGPLYVKPALYTATISADGNAIWACAKAENARELFAQRKIEIDKLLSKQSGILDWSTDEHALVTK